MAVNKNPLGDQKEQNANAEEQGSRRPYSPPSVDNKPMALFLQFLSGAGGDSLGTRKQ